MSNWHLAYEKEQAEDDGPGAIRPIYSETIAVVCSKCRPISLSEEALQMNSVAPHERAGSMQPITQE
jgi:hypothetical protein